MSYLNDSLELLLEQCLADVELHYVSFNEAVSLSVLSRSYAKRFRRLTKNDPRFRLVDSLRNDARFFCMRNKRGRWFVAPVRVKESEGDWVTHKMHFNVFEDA